MSRKTKSLMKSHDYLLFTYTVYHCQEVHYNEHFLKIKCES